MIDYAASGLIQTTFFELLDGQKRSLGSLEGVRSMTRERSIYTSPRTSAALELTPQSDIDWGKCRVRAWSAVRSPDGEATDSVPLFTGIPVVSGGSRNAATAPVSLRLLDFSCYLDAPVGRNYAAAPGATVTQLVWALLAELGLTDAVITESSAPVGSGSFWAGTETYRRVINDLLKSAGYSAVWADEWGRIRVEPYVGPSSRPVAPDLGFIHGRTCTYHPEFTIEHDTANVPNVAVITPRADERVEPPVGSYTLPLDHPYSAANRNGLVVPYVESGVDLAVSPLPEDPEIIDLEEYQTRLQEAATQYAQRALLSRVEPSRSFVVENRWRPFNLQQATRLYAPARGASPEVRTTVTIAKDSLRYQAGEPIKMTTTLLEV